MEMEMPLEQMKRLHHVCVVSFLMCGMGAGDAEAEPIICPMPKLGWFWAGGVGGYASRSKVELV